MNSSSSLDHLLIELTFKFPELFADKSKEKLSFFKKYLKSDAVIFDEVQQAIDSPYFQDLHSWLFEFFH